jgi:hypothetical protein
MRGPGGMAISLSVNPYTMRTREEFESFYNRELKSTLDGFESQRQRIAQKYSYKRYGRNLKWLAVLAVGIVILQNAFEEVIPEQVIFTVPAVILYAIIAPIYIALKRSVVFSPVEKEYKKTVVPKVIAFIDGSLTYEAASGIPVGDFNSGGLFQRPTTYRSEDLIKGSAGARAIRMADISCSRRESRGKSGSSQVTIFRGFYAITSLEQSFTSRIIILPTNPVSDLAGGFARKLLGDHLVDTLADTFGAAIVRTNDDEFDKSFTVRSEDPAQAERLLTPIFLQLIKAFRKEADTPVYLSFFDDQMHVGFSGPDLFEIDAHTSVTEKNVTYQYFRYVSLVLALAGTFQKM